MFAFVKTSHVPFAATTGISAPLDLSRWVGKEGWTRLPKAIQRRFAVGHADTAYLGQMDLRCSVVGHLFAALAHLLGGPLTHMNMTNVPTRVRVSANEHGGVVWERSFHPEGQQQARIVRSTKEADADGSLLEHTDGGLSMSLDVYEENGSLVFCSRRFCLAWGRFRLPIPAWLTPGTCRVSHTDLGDGQFRFSLSMVHPLWGETFHQTGVFVDPS